MLWRRNCYRQYEIEARPQLLQQPCYSYNAGRCCSTTSSDGKRCLVAGPLAAKRRSWGPSSGSSRHIHPCRGDKGRAALTPQAAPGSRECMQKHNNAARHRSDFEPELASCGVISQYLASSGCKIQSTVHDRATGAAGLLSEPHQDLYGNVAHSSRQQSLHEEGAGLEMGSYVGHSETVRGLVYGATVRFSDSAALRLRRRAMVVWEQNGPKRVLIVKKPIAAAATMLLEMAEWLQKQGVQVFVEAVVHELEFPQFPPFNLHNTLIDFAITLGGDGTVLHLASMFDEDKPLPPVMCFAMGTLGFLTPFDAASYRNCLSRLLAANNQPFYCTLRTRKRCVVINATGAKLQVHHILNECVIDRGACPSSVQLEIYVDGGFVTAAEADGLIVATPSGSTAYSMSAGGSMVAPSVPCTLLTPLSPHSLSFRPLIIPENADLLIRLPQHARTHARASFDGKHPMKIERGGCVHFTTSLCPLPLINIGSLDTDWYEGITHKLKWNQRIRSHGVDNALTTNPNPK